MKSLERKAHKKTMYFQTDKQIPHQLKQTRWKKHLLLFLFLFNAVVHYPVLEIMITFL